jgi:hypothetical protein
MKKLVEHRGMYFTKGTDEKVMDILCNFCNTDTRIRIFYGDKKTGKDWCEIYDTIGYIGRSCGTQKIPLLINNKRSLGGGGILTDCILKITVDKQVLYKHPKYHLNLCIKKVGEYFQIARKFTKEVLYNCKDENSAIRNYNYLLGIRNNY